MATLSELLRNSIAGNQTISDVEKQLNPVGTIPVQRQQPFQFRPATDFMPPPTFQAAKPSLGEYALPEVAPVQPALPSGAQPQTAPRQQTEQRVAGGVRTPRVSQATATAAAPAPVSQSLADGRANLEAYMARTGVTDTPRAPLEILDASGNRVGAAPALIKESDAPMTFEERQAAQPLTAYTNSPAGQQLFDERTAAFQAYLASPEGQAEQARQAALPNANLVEVVRGDKTTFENVGAAGNTAALRDYLFGQQQTEQQQRDYMSAVSKPVGAPLTLGEAEALKLGERALQVEGATDVAGIGAGAQIQSARINAAAGKNPLYDAAAEDIAATTDPAQRALKLQQYLGGSRATTTADPMDKVYAEQLMLPEEQQAYAGLRALNEKPAAAFAAVKAKFRKE